MGISTIPKWAYHIFGLGLGAIGIYLLSISDTNLLLWFSIALIGAMLYNGLPDYQEVIHLLKVSPVVLIVSIALVLFFSKTFGGDILARNVLGVLFGIVVVQTFLIRAYNMLFN